MQVALSSCARGVWVVFMLHRVGTVGRGARCGCVERLVLIVRAACAA